MLRVDRVEPLPGLWLRLTLTDGTIVDRGIGDLLIGPVFDAIRSDASRFGTVSVANGTVAWPGDLDLDPDVLIWGGPPDDAPTSRPAPILQVRRPATLRV